MTPSLMAMLQIHDQRDAKRKVEIQLSKTKLLIGQDALEFAVRSSHSGYLYVALAASDNQSMYMIFPNELDGSNEIQAGVPFKIPSNKWRLRAAGPAGKEQLLVMVTDAPRDFSYLSKATKAGPFVKSLNDTRGRAALGALLTSATSMGNQPCFGTFKNMRCSDAFGSVLLTLEEYTN